MTNTSTRNTSTRTLEGVRHILTVKNATKLLTTGPETPGTEIRCLRTNSFGHYMPCVAYIVSKTASGRFVVDLWVDKSERVTVSPKAVLWIDPVANKNLEMGKRGSITFTLQAAAEQYLRDLPDNYVGKVSKTDSGKWMVSYTRQQTTAESIVAALDRHAKGLLVPCRVGKQLHLSLAERGFQTHHLDGNMVWLSGPVAAQ